MQTLVIHPKDSTTDFLSEIYSDKDWSLINTNPSKKYLKEQIKKHDRIVMLGHGLEQGLLGFNRLVINSDWVYLLREKLCVCIWCNADKFVKKYRLRGFYTGMIISNSIEAILHRVSSNRDSINESNKDFALAIKNSIDDENMLEKAKLLYKGNSAVVEYNRNNLYYEALS